LFVEIATVILCVWAFLLYGFSEQYVIMTAFSVTAVVVVGMDIDKHYISDKTLLVLLCFGLIHRGMHDPGIYNLLYGGALMLTVGMVIRHVYYRFIKKDIETAMDYTKYSTDDKFAGPGFPYIKLMTVCGVWIGFSDMLIFLPVIVLLLVATMLLYKILKQPDVPYSLPLLVPLLLVVFQG
ncbi:MAG: hypothetical protein MK137_03630, partial [Rickettsiales bacterium]|nr:hypothetical protein [Rickettsiales bacterium]